MQKEKLRTQQLLYTPDSFSYSFYYPVMIIKRCKNWAKDFLALCCYGVREEENKEYRTRNKEFRSKNRNKEFRTRAVHKSLFIILFLVRHSLFLVRYSLFLKVGENTKEKKSAIPSVNNNGGMFYSWQLKGMSGELTAEKK